MVCRCSGGDKSVSNVPHYTSQRGGGAAYRICQTPSNVPSTARRRVRRDRHSYPLCCQARSVIVVDLKPLPQTTNSQITGRVSLSFPSCTGFSCLRTSRGKSMRVLPGHACRVNAAEPQCAVPAEWPRVTIARRFTSESRGRALSSGWLFLPRVHAPFRQPA